MKIRLLASGLFALLLVPAWSQRPPEDRQERFRRMSREAEERGLAESFRGVTADGKVRGGLFRIEKTGVTTEPVRKAAEAFLTALSAEQREKATFPVDDPEWRKWMNQHFYLRQGVSFEEMEPEQREAAFELLQTALSDDGFKLIRDIMRLNYTLGELNDNDFEEYGEWRYWLTVMGEPSATEPWGFQLDGHHAIVNYFVLGDQVVATPLFVGSEPVVAESGKFKGTAILQREQRQGLELIRALSEAQRDKAILEVSKSGNNNLTEAFKDNVVLDYAGAPVAEFSANQKERLMELVGLFVGNLEAGHAQVRMEEIEKHLDETRFAWIGGTNGDSVFYYRIHSPVVLIEFDHQRPANLRHMMPPVPSRQHIHAVVRTPNGGDYGKDLLRQHYERHSHAD